MARFTKLVPSSISIKVILVESQADTVFFLFSILFITENLNSVLDNSLVTLFMLNPQNKILTDDNKRKSSSRISVVLLTQNRVKPMFQHPSQVMSAIPREISKEIIVVHYNGSSKYKGDFDQAVESTPADEGGADEKVLHVKVHGEFTSGVMQGIELSSGKYILVMDADLPYSRKIIPELISELMAHPDSIIVASRFIQDAHVQHTSIIQNTVGRVARLVAKYGLKIKNVKDPTSSCFAFSRHIIEDIRFEGKGKEALLEILVKASNNQENEVPVKEIPIKEYDGVISRKLNYARISNYSRDVWELYKHGKKSKLGGETKGQEIHRSVRFLSKAGRFFTVGASGLAINYVASFLISNLVPNIWYIHATLFGIIISITSNFLLNKIWTFEDRDFSLRHFFRQYVLFIALCALGATIQLSLVYAFVEYSNIPYAVSLIVAVCIASLSNFVLNKKITFEERIWE